MMTQGWANDRPKRGDIHRGVDLRAAIGTPISAIGSGKVIIAEYGSATAGNYVGIQHYGGLISRYLHLSQINVQNGQQVSKGQQIGVSGCTGDCAGPHLHHDIIVPAEKLGTFRSLFGDPPAGYGYGGVSLGLGVKVPAEWLIPVDTYDTDVLEFSRTHQMPLKGGMERWIAAGALVAGGFVAWKLWLSPEARRKRLG
jgi:murein DD-endopeptidase MepM/ murein hydrolase activator NlpD